MELERKEKNKKPVMGKVYREDERKKQDHCSESYEVRFWYQKEDGYWVQGRDMYFTSDKGQHDDVLNRWKRDYKSKKVQLITIVYQ